MYDPLWVTNHDVLSAERLLFQHATFGDTESMMQLLCKFL